MNTNSNDWVPVGKVHAMNINRKSLELELQVTVISGIAYYRVHVLSNGAYLTGESYHAISNHFQGKSSSAVASYNTHYILYSDNDRYYFSI